MSASAFQDVLAQIHNVPHELQVRRQWICYRAVPSKKRAGKTDKLPCSPFSGEVINAHDPAQWADFSQAVDYVRSHPQQVSGVGFVLTAEDPFVGIDLDNCVRRGEIKPWAMEIVNKLITLMSRVDAEFDPLWRGDASRYGGDRAADAALCRKLAYYTQGDAQRMDRLFRVGGLMRDKWDERRGSDTYGSNTIAYAIQKSKASGKVPPFA
ncbi:hypothetical protein GC175_01345 [bacterium]|nr:hypothetical protein [bacterium]